jgi:dTDP-4-amino-4,6-dideoxygalactose transaminase
VAIVPVHLYGQCADMNPILNLAKRHGLHVIEDVAQALGADYIFPESVTKKAGTLGIIGTTSFFPSKNLGAFGDGGALFTKDPFLAEKIRMIANHGQKKKYHHDVIGINSRLDTLQAAVLKVKLTHLDDYAQKRRRVAAFYDLHLNENRFIKIPSRVPYSTHVFHQYTVTVEKGSRDELKSFLQEKGIPTMVYYPVPLHLQLAYIKEGVGAGAFPVSEKFSETVLSLPIHTEMNEEQLSYICHAINSFR